MSGKETTILAALLYDTIEDTAHTKSQLLASYFHICQQFRLRHTIC